MRHMLFLSTLLAVLACSKTQKDEIVLSDMAKKLGTADWEERFNALDENRWSKEVTVAGGGNFEFQFYTSSDQNVFTKEGILYLKPGLTKDYKLTKGQRVGCGPKLGENILGGEGYALSDKIVGGCGKDNGNPVVGCPIWDIDGAIRNDEAPENGCTATQARHYWLDLGPSCTDNGQNYMTKELYEARKEYGCKPTSGFVVSKLDPRCPGNECPGYFNIMSPVTSGRIYTKNAKDDQGGFLYGRLEIRAKMPKGDWLWPAIWMLPKTPKYKKTDPEILDSVAWPFNGEIDILEGRGNSRECSENYMEKHKGSAFGGIQSFASTLHFGPRFDMNGFARAHTEYAVPMNQKTLDEEFHVYGLRWSEKGLYTYIDKDENRILEVSFTTPFWELATRSKIEHCLLKGPKTITSAQDAFKCVFMETVNPENWSLKNPWPEDNPKAPFDQPFYLILNVAIGGTAGEGTTAYFPDGWCNKPWENGHPNPELGKPSLRQDGNYNYAVSYFYENQQQWLSSWMKDGRVGEHTALQIDSIQYWKEDRAGKFGL